MKDSIDKIYLFLIPILVVGISFNIIPFSVALLALIIRLAYTNKHTAGIFLILFGGILASTIRFEIPELPIYGLVLNFIGILLVWDEFKYFKNEKSSISLMITVLIYFFLAYILSSNVNDLRASDKIVTIIQNGLLMLFAYFVFIHSEDIINEDLTQLLFLTTIIFLIHNMNLLDIAPNSFFDYEWHRQGTDVLYVIMDNGETFKKWVNYQVVGVNALFGVCIYLSQIEINLKKAIFYSLIGLQLVLTSGARQAIFGFFVIVMLSIILFNRNNENYIDFRKLLKYVFGGALAIFVSLQILELLNLDFISDTFTEGDAGRDMLSSMGWELFYKYPFFGSGIGGFNHNYPGMLYPHNFFIEVLCECGIIGALFFLIIVIYHFKRENLSIFYVTRNGTFLFLIMAVTGIRMMVSNDLSSSIELFSIIFACSYTANEFPDEELI